MSYEDNQRRIALLLEERIPLLRRDVAGKDFRPGGGGEKIVSGVMSRARPNEITLLEPSGEPFDENGPTDFKVIFGSEKLCNDAAEVLKAYGIEVTVIPPHSETVSCDGEWSKIRVFTWRVRFTLPQGWTL